MENYAQRQRAIANAEKRKRIRKKKVIRACINASVIAFLVMNSTLMPYDVSSLKETLGASCGAIGMSIMLNIFMFDIV